MTKDFDQSQFLFNSTKAPLAQLDWRKILPWLVGALSLLIAGGLSWWLWSKFATRPATQSAVTTEPTNNTSIGRLNDKLGTSSLPIIGTPDRNETLAFGDFYRLSPAPASIGAKGVDLPTNVKEQTANYYAVNREISLTPEQLQHFNTNGFVVIDNPFAKQSNDFFSIYKTLNQKNLPFLVTNDFLFYYYQNTLKSIFKQLESELFYQETWAFNKAMFEIANKRYLDRYAKVGLVNDTVLEAMRLEAAYFAVTLELLKVKANQIIPDSQASVTTKEWFKLQFSEREAETYKFTVPSYLALDVERELALIGRAKTLTKPVRSPILLYNRNYQDFVLPATYDRNYRLSNFYLALAWSSSLLPLYYQSPDCPDCLLDKSDWLIHQGAAQLIARDLHVHQDLKNQWAKIYKAYAYFSGLRSELTYLDYSDAFIKLFGDGLEKQEGNQTGKTIEQIFDSANPERDLQLTSLQSELAARSFDPAKGGLDRQTALGRANSGLRMVQSSYWPTQYIYDRLTFSSAGAYLDNPREINKATDKSFCDVNGAIVRCRGIGLDIINPIFNEPINNNYFARNTRFQNYFNQTPALRQHFNGFDTRAWHQSFFWSNLHASQQFLNQRKLDSFAYTATNAWSNTALNTALGAVVNASLPYDQWKYAYQQERGLSGQELIKYNYLEPNLTLVEELLANSQMVFAAFVQLGLVKENNQEFNDLFTDLNAAKALILKERAGQETDFSDWSFMNNLVNKYYVVAPGNKTVEIDFRDSANPGKISTMEQSLQGVKLLLSVHFHQGRNLILVGPVFNFNERPR